MARRPNDFLQDNVSLVFEHAASSDNRTDKLYLVPSGRKLRITRVLYWSLAGLAEDTTNYFTLTVKNGSTAVSVARNTKTGEGGSIAANTFVTLSLSATDANRVLAAGDTLSLDLAESGTATLPAGRVIVEGHLL